MVAESNSHKAEANALFTSGKYDAALNKYDEAVALCPSYLDYEIAVLRSNIAACHLKLEEWKEAISNATAALDGLDRLERQAKKKEAAAAAADDDDRSGEKTESAEAEIVSPGAAEAGGEAHRARRDEDIARIRAKALMRRARARSELGGWANLEGAIEDYKRLAGMCGSGADGGARLGPADERIVRAQLAALPARARAAQERETAEMWAKLKDLGNGLLRPFGLSTDNFKMVKDEKTGGYSLSFQGGGGGRGASA